MKATKTHMHAKTSPTRRSWKTIESPLELTNETLNPEATAPLEGKVSTQSCVEASEIAEYVAPSIQRA